MDFLPCNNAPSLTQVLRALKRAEHGLYNCIASIVHDVEFVEEVGSRYPGLPILPNLRCGAWYTPTPTDTCVFKSTDGHSGNWSFSTARLNLHVADLAESAGGCIIVDATRRGKRFPDALSKTIPMWAAVVNLAVAHVRGAGRAATWDAEVHLPPWVPDSEMHQVQGRLEAWAQDLLQVSPDVQGLAQRLRKPLRCLWVAQDSPVWEAGPVDVASLAFTPLILVSASLSSGRQRRCLSLGDMQLPFDYVPGAGDDEETWARGLTPALMWRHHVALLAAGPTDAEALAVRLLAAQGGHPGASRARGASRVQTDGHHARPAGACTGPAATGTLPGTPAVVHGTTLCLAPGRARHHLPALDAVLDVGTSGVLGPGDCLAGDAQGPTSWHPVPSSKQNREGLALVLPAILALACPALRAGRRLGIVGDEGGDAVACSAVAALAAVFVITAEGALEPRAPDAGPPTLSKLDVRRYLAIVSAACPQARPTRGMLKQVFAHFHAQAREC